ncbi:hypothetical protein [Flagellimonas sediminis]|uniref:Uncharacterized protein n=1 Tax=Flagellimonas sediminis TaxID=2696468 RepID=A0A6I5KPH5_9FLAO|nr:hypothetical protein [Allomuricauda sediminis]NDV42447.1 hypothetical protein [Allomuricauda sediminis]
MPVKEHLPLEPADIKKLRQQLFAMLVFPVVVIGMFLLFISFVFKDFKTSFAGDTVVMYVFIGFCLFFFGIIAYMVGTTAIDLRRGIKHRISGKIMDKLTITSNRRSNSNAIRTTQGTITVNTVLYDKLSVGDGITIFMTQYGNRPISLLTMDQEEFYLV